MKWNTTRCVPCTRRTRGASPPTGGTSGPRCPGRPGSCTRACRLVSGLACRTVTPPPSETRLVAASGCFRSPERKHLLRGIGRRGWNVATMAGRAEFQPARMRCLEGSRSPISKSLPWGSCDYSLVDHWHLQKVLCCACYPERCAAPGLCHASATSEGPLSKLCRGLEYLGCGGRNL